MLTPFAITPPSTTASMAALLSMAAVVFQVMVLGIAIRTYRSQRTEPLRHLMWAWVCYVVPHVTEYLVFFVPGFLYPQKYQLGHARAPWWIDFLDPISVILFAVFMILAFKSLMRERNSAATPRI